MQRKMLIISYGKYPNGNAGAVRQHTFAKAFIGLGYDVTVIGMGDSTDFKLKEFEGVHYVSFRKSPNSIINRCLNWVLYGKRLKRFLHENNDYTDILFVKTYFESVINYLKKYARKNKIKLYHDSVEWYSPEEFRFGKIDLGYIKNNRMNVKLIDKQFHVIAISTFLENYFRSKGIDTIRIPVIMDSQSIDYKKEITNKIVFSYAGRIGKKDYIANIITAFLLLSDKEKQLIEFRLMGATKEQVSLITGISLDILANNSDTIRCMGRVPREEVLLNLRQTDFTVLIRDPKLRYAKAGFPTKVVESLMSGTPVICNLSSDLGEYIVDGKNAFISDGMQPELVCDAIRRAIQSSTIDRDKMKYYARKTAEEFFDYHNYIEPLQLWSSKE